MCIAELERSAAHIADRKNDLGAASLIDVVDYTILLKY